MIKNKSDFSTKDQFLLKLVEEEDSEGFKVACLDGNAWDDENILDLCLREASSRKNWEIVKFIYETLEWHFSECYPFYPKHTPLLEAARQGNMEMVLFLLEREANPYAVTRNGCNIVYEAIISGNTELVKFLLDNDIATWQGYTWEGFSALHGAVMSKNPDMFTYILSLGGLRYENQPFFLKDCKMSMQEFIATIHEFDDKGKNQFLSLLREARIRKAEFIIREL